MPKQQPKDEWGRIEELEKRKDLDPQFRKELQKHKRALKDKNMMRIWPPMELNPDEPLGPRLENSPEYQQHIAALRRIPADSIEAQWIQERLDQMSFDEERQQEMAVGDVARRAIRKAAMEALQKRKQRAQAPQQAPQPTAPIKL